MVGEINFNLLNANAPQQVAQAWDLPGAYLKGVDQGRARKELQRQNAFKAQQDQQTLANSQQVNQLNQQKLQTGQMGIDKQVAYDNALAQAGNDTNALITATNQFDPAAGQKLQKGQLEQKKMELDQQLKLYDISRQSASRVAAASDASILKVAQEEVIRVAGLTGKNPQEGFDMIAKVYGNGGPEGLRKAASSSMLNADQMMERLKVEGQQGNVRRGQDIKAETAAEETEVAKKRAETAAKNAETAANRLNWQLETADDPDAFDWISKYAAEGQLDLSRLRSSFQYKHFNAAAQYAADNDLAFDPLQAMNDASRARATGSSGGGRIALAQKMNIEVSYDLLDDMAKSYNKINFSGMKYKALAEKFLKGQVQDPLLAEVMTQRVDALMKLTAAMKMNGVTDKSLEMEEAAAMAAASPKAFQAWRNQQIRALNSSAKAMNRNYGYGIKTHETRVAGTGGAGPVDRSKETGTPKAVISLTNEKGWKLYEDADGNKAYVSPDGKSFEEVE